MNSSSTACVEGTRPAPLNRAAVVALLCAVAGCSTAPIHGRTPAAAAGVDPSGVLASTKLPLPVAEPEAKKTAQAPAQTPVRDPRAVASAAVDSTPIEAP